MNLDLEVPRNADFYEEIQLTDVDGVPINLTGHTVESDARVIAGDGAVIASATIVIVEPLDGRFSMRWRGDHFDAIGDKTQVVRVAYDVKHTYPDGVRVVPFRGNLLLVPESTV